LVSRRGRVPDRSAGGKRVFRFDRNSAGGYNEPVVELPPDSRRNERSPVIILVTGRTAVARVGGISAIRRHVATASRLGLTPIVVYPPRMTALGAEIDADLDGSAQCVPADAFDGQAGDDETAEALVIAADWFVSPAALYAFGRQTRGAAVARFVDRGRVVAPVARIPVARLRTIVERLDDAPVSELIDRAAAADAAVVELAVGDRHRLSDNVAIERCERKLFGLGPHRALPRSVRVFERYVAIPIARFLARTTITPLQVSLAKIFVGCLAVVTMTGGGYVRGVVASLLYLVSRVLDAVAGDLSRAAVKPASRGERFDMTADLAIHVMLIWAIALRPRTGRAEVIAAVLLTVGLLVSCTLTYRKVLRPVWDAHVSRLRHRIRPDNFASRFWRRNGPAYSLLLAAACGRLDLFLWGAALASHMFYVLWLRDETREAVP
jgi:phosphatidylglycerophosphate synthase